MINVIIIKLKCMNRKKKSLRIISEGFLFNNGCNLNKQRRLFVIQKHEFIVERI